MTAPPAPGRSAAPDALRAATPVGDVTEAFASLVAERFGARSGERFTMVLSGGPTAESCYRRVAALPAGAVDWSLVDTYMGDERMVPADDPDANQRLVREALVDVVGCTFTPMPTEGDPQACAEAYQKVMADVLAGPGFDLVHLGLGPDGHTASLFPGASTLDMPPDKLVAATTDPGGHNPHPRLTLTLGAIGRARLATFTVVGESKRDAVARLRAGEDLPAARVHAGEVRWLVDGDAWA